MNNAVLMIPRDDLIPAIRQRLADEAGGVTKPTDYRITSVTERVVSETVKLVLRPATAEEQAAIKIAEGINDAADRLVPRNHTAERS